MTNKTQNDHYVDDFEHPIFQKYPLVNQCGLTW